MVHDIDTVPSLFLLAWALQIVERLKNLESNMENESQQNISIGSTMDKDMLSTHGGSQDRPQHQAEDNYIMERDTSRDMQTYPELLEALTSIKDEFFKSALTDIQQRRFLASCPRNEDMDYDPPVLNNLGVSFSAKKMDNQLLDIQYRISGITRPIDFFTQKIIQNDGQMDFQETKDFVKIIRILLPDVASHITQIRKELVDTKTLLDHATTTQTIRKTLENVRKNSQQGFNFRRFGSENYPNNIQQQNRPVQLSGQQQGTTRLKYKPHSFNNSNNRAALLEIAGEESKDCRRKAIEVPISMETTNRQQMDTGHNNTWIQDTVHKITVNENNKGEKMPEEER
ncbi:hypothetical protein BB559_003388 [Furculomyces boomerangus]|uniref:Uncharacterized protein n=1 Tax=Furculomyces boomerangus TaxID=61424 RepID=A0A2T9YLK6_9FUNG|nr:hypothetical protein BB559_003388 [Furculomyces boomerangus]